MGSLSGSGANNAKPMNRGCIPPRTAYSMGSDRLARTSYTTLDWAINSLKPRQLLVTAWL